MKLKKDFLCYSAIVLYLFNIIFFNGLKWNENIIKFSHFLGGITKILIFIILFIYFTMDIKKYIIEGNINDKKRLLIFLSLVFSYFTFLITKSDTLLWTNIFIYLTNRKTLDKKYKVYFKTILTILIMLIICNILGLTINKQTIFSYGTGNSLGMSHPNVLAALIVNITLLFCYTYTKERKIINTILPIVVAIIVLNYCCSRTAFIILVLYSMFTLFGFITDKYNNKWLKKLIKAFMLLTIGLSICISIFNFSFFKTDDNNFNARFTQTRKIYEMYGIKPLGSNIKFITIEEAKTMNTRPIILDNAYSRLILYYGIISTIFFIFYIIYLINQGYKIKNNRYMKIILLFIIYGIMEKYLLMFAYNFTLMGIETNELGGDSGE